ncbi:MAG: STAS domain-containing protein [candidate division NC10 bacterium]|nr:STAS domain-containing protein [candidate division NC10 bacterium]
MTYNVSQHEGWVILRLKGKARNNEPIRAKRHLLPWLSVSGVRVVVDVGGLQELGVWERGLLNSLRKEVDLLNGTLRLCSLDPTLRVQFRQDRFTEAFAIYPDVVTAMSAREEDNERDGKDGPRR